LLLVHINILPTSLTFCAYLATVVCFKHKNNICYMIVYQKMAVALKIEMHCEACSEEMKRRILKIKGIDRSMFPLIYLILALFSC
jgi:hypothetical protein